MQSARQSEEYRKKDRDYTLKSMQSARQSEEYRKKDREYTLKSMQSARQSEECRRKDKAMTKANRRRARLIEAYKKWESEKKKESRKCPEFKQKDIAIQNRSRRKARSDPYILEQERVAKQQWRLNERNKKAENIIDCKRKATKRKDSSFSQVEKLTAKHKKYGSDIDVCIERFHKNVSVGPIYVCSCCHQTWFADTVSKAKTFACKDKEKYLTGVKSVKEEEWICCTCKDNIKCGKVPKLSVLNGMKWPPKPKELELFPLEERLISLRIPFMQMRELPRGRQLSVKGNVVNVPVDIQPVVNALPRPFDETVTVAVKLKKKMSFKSYVFSENIRPFHVLCALHWLMSGSELYKHANVEIDQHWIKRITEESNETLHAFLESQETSCSETDNVDFEGALDESLQDIPHVENQAEIINKFFKWCTKECSNYDTVDFDGVVSEMCYSCSNDKIDDISNDKTSHVEEIYDSDAEEITQENVGNIDTLLDDADIENRNSTFTFAPGEGQRPLSIFQDKDSEYLCFPTIFCGQRRIDNDDRKVPVHYSDIAKWELRSQDRRAANSVPNIFFKLKKIQMKQLNDKANLAVRRCQTGANNITAVQARNSECIDSIVKNDEGYYLFKQLRNSPAYLESRKKDVYAMIRQLGLPTWFMSLSSADTRWIDLLKMLSILNKNMNYTDEQIENLAWEQKIKLIQSDPVTCSRYFEHRVKEFINTVLKSEHNPLGKVVDYFFRVEFQQRGSPHIHMIVWVQNAPKFNVDSDAELAAYVDQYLKCSIDNPNLSGLIELQIHKHSRTCRKRDDKICRFGYPLPPLSKTMVLQPLETEKDKYYKLYQNIQKTMNNKKDGYDMSYEEFLTDVVQMSEEEYIKCIRSSLNTSKVFLKRNPSEIRVNLYNDSVLRAWKANIDIQFVLDPYACAMYIVSYISKSQRGMSNLLHAAAKEARNGNMDLKRQVRHIGNVFSNSVEVSAQEAVYLVLQMPLTKSSRNVVFINTSLPNQRVQLLKPKSVLDELPADSTDIMADNKIKRYSKRPKLLESYCLADYVSELEVIYPDGQNDNRDEEEQDYEQDANMSDEESFSDSETVLTLKNGIKIKRCRNSRIIRYVRFNRKTDEENYYREKLLLFHPWRKEETDLLGTFRTYKEHYESIKTVIDHKCSTYEHHAEELELARDLAEIEYDAFDDIAPSTQQVEGDDAETEPIQSEEFIYFNPDKIEHRDYDIGTEIGCYVSSPQIDVNENILSDIDYRKLLQCLNSKQKQFYYHVIHWIKTKDAPLYAFLSGGAGVGKSLVIRALYQTLFRILNLKEGEDADHTRVLLCAFTGKAAFNINGSTISSAFKQKYKQSDQTLTCDSLNTFRSKYRDLSVVIIDEISMVSNSMLNFIDQRLQALKGTRTPFGGVSIIAVGDLYQLKPVSGDWIFNDMKNDAAALSRNLWKDLFTMFELTEIMRQKDDLEFAEMLNRLRINALTPEDKTRFKQCEVSTNDIEYQKNAPHLFAENYFMHVFNDEIIRNMGTEKVEIPCMDTYVSPKLSKEKIDSALKNLKNVTDSNQTANLHCSLTVVVDMIYDLTINIKTEDGLANGASCVVKFIEYKLQTTRRPSIIWVQFDDKNAGMETRSKYRNRGLYHSTIDDNWTPIFDVNRSFTYNRKTFQRVQFPLQPSAGRSVHRAQGSTLERVVIDLSQRKTRKVPHLHYVALSRVRSIEKLQILNFNEKALQVDDQVKAEMQRLNETAMLQLCHTSLELIDPISHFKVAFNNCRSLNLHFDDIRHDKNLLSTHIFGLAETRLHQQDNDNDYAIEGYCLIRNDQIGYNTSKRPPHGLAVYVKNDTIVTQDRKYSSDTLEFIMITARHVLIESQIVFLYKSPQMSDSNLLSCLNKELIPYFSPSKPVMIIGDFNIDVLLKPNSIKKLSEKLSCKMLINDCTTDHMTTLDLIFSNFDLSDVDGAVGTCETYWSDHKIVFLHIKPT
ncbi:MAG: AAA family ATPase [Candidatus Thiodiazotropha endolucinida]|nr:AAA family ATPase [Candidatus Thiodiazotropha taylori]MCW4260555.1 AAA family ATPase [Candidatus Thiodiazotropha endolucinida]